MSEHCYICGRDKPVESYAFWYDGESRGLCGLSCRSHLLELCEKFPEKTYPGKDALIEELKAFKEAMLELHDRMRLCADDTDNAAAEFAANKIKEALEK